MRKLNRCRLRGCLAQKLVKREAVGVAGALLRPVAPLPFCDLKTALAGRHAQRRDRDDLSGRTRAVRVRLGPPDE